MHHVRSSIVTALIVLTGLLAGAASASAYGEQPFKIVYDNNSTFCLEAVKDSFGIWSTTRLGFCESRYDPNRTTFFALTSAGELRPLDDTVDCIGGPPCFASRCIDGDVRLNYVYLKGCSRTASQKYEYTGWRQLANGNGRCISAVSDEPGEALRTVSCSDDSRQRWSLK